MVEQRKKKTVLLMVDDDEDDCLLMKDAIREVFQSENFRCLCDGQELMDYLLHRGIYSDPETSPPPDLIFLDLNMPRKDGFETLKEIKKPSATQGHSHIDLLDRAGTKGY
jgi:two-component system, response regulator